MAKIADRKIYSIEAVKLDLATRQSAIFISDENRGLVGGGAAGCGASHERQQHGDHAATTTMIVCSFREFFVFNEIGWADTYTNMPTRAAGFPPISTVKQIVICPTDLANEFDYSFSYNSYYKIRGIYARKRFRK